MPARTIAIGDIHGFAAPLDALLEAVEPTVDDTIVILGDFIDRGPDTRKVIDRLIDLAGSCQLVPIIPVARLVEFRWRGNARVLWRLLSY